MIDVIDDGQPVWQRFLGEIDSQLGTLRRLRAGGTTGKEQERDRKVAESHSTSMNCLGAGSWTGAAGRTTKVGTSGAQRKNGYEPTGGSASSSAFRDSDWPLYLAEG